MTTLDESQIEEVFTLYDKDGSGVLEKGELKSALQLLCIDLDDAELMELAAGEDGDADTLTLNEFKDIVNSETITKTNFKDRTAECFREFTDGTDGTISKETLMAILTQRGENPMEAEEAEQLLNEFDANADGVFDIEELTKMMYSSSEAQTDEVVPEEEPASEDA